MAHQLSFERLILERNVLGRHGWLDRIILGVVDYEGKLLLNRYFGA